MRPVHIRAIMAISIHALLTESDRYRPKRHPGLFISIHALLTESDLWVLMGGSNCDDFYPRSPYGERRRIRQRNKFRDSHFYPRSPYGERRYCSGRTTSHRHFYPRSPYGERRFRLRRTYLDTIISIHALLTESDFTQILTGSTGG